MKYLLVMFVISLKILNIAGESTKIKNLTMCEEKYYPFRIVANITDIGDHQTMSLDVTVDVILDDQLTSALSIEVSDDGVNYKKLFTIKNKFCSGLFLNHGEFAYRMMRAAGFLHKCPIPKGHYHIPPQDIDFNNIRIPQLPVGYVKMTMSVHDTAKHIVTCIDGSLHHAE